MAVADAGRISSPRDRWYNNPTVRSIATQVILVVIVVSVIAWLTHNTTTNLRERGIASGFDFLGKRAGFDMTKIVAIDEHVACIGVDETHEKLRDGRLASTARPADGEASSRRDMKRQAIEHRYAGPVSEVNTDQVDGPPGPQLLRLRRLADHRRRSREVRQSLGRRSGGREATSAPHHDG